ncbi:RagB/SusD family nutrient uptake outer membrane protein [Maribellus mangrovi]|uniref:RagB/SusD family nutrient uptake outer membrane protein n=1 Tax=Maribellus mangrovi TaxID=3133146 RepID=UPI0030EE192B
MKVIFKIYTLLSIFLIFSCSDQLDETPIDAIDADYIYSSEAGLESGITGLYNKMRELNYDEGTGSIFSSVFFRIATDLGLGRVNLDQCYNPNRYNANWPMQNWGRLYYIIDRSNAIIAFASDIDMDQDKKDVLLAQARAIRAEVYMQLYTTYNNIIFKPEPTTIENIDQIDYTPADPADIWALVDSDLDFAISKLDWVVEPGRYGQGVVRHLRGISAMWQEDWQEAVNQFDAIVENGTHHLVEVDEVFTGDKNHAESLYTYQTSRALGGGNELAGGGPSALASMFNCRIYELSSGEMIPEVQYGGLAFGWAFPNDYCQSLYDRENDKRYTTYYYEQNYIVNNPDHPNFGQPLPESSIEDNYRRYHFSLKKFHDPDKPASSDQSYQNFVHYRFAETLLFGAEAHWHLSGSNTDAKALEYINMVRRRAFGDNNHDYTTIDLDSYLEEHAREMALEASRWYVLKRLGVLVERVNLHFQGGSNSGNVHGVQMEDYMVNYPIPQSQIDLMKGFPQNPGYTQ